MRIRFGAFVLDAGSRTVERQGEELHLSGKAFDLLQILVAEQPKAVSKTELLNRIWPDVVVEEENIKNLVWEIRNTLKERGFVRTVHRFGYALGVPTHIEEDAVVAPRTWLQHEARMYALSDGENYIGRDPTCGVFLHAPGVSRRHARIVLSNGSAVIEDLQSKNGTRVRDARIDGPTELKDGDQIHFGWTRVTFRVRRAGDITVSERSKSKIGRRSKSIRVSRSG
jgi:DNA-binding winged helix-turn-helix (wHTH) protein